MGLGQFLGKKNKYNYEDDGGRLYTITRDITLATDAKIGLTAFDPATNTDTLGTLPKGFQPRGVYWQANADQGDEVAGARKFIICGTALAPLYDSNGPQSLTIDGIVGTTTGRRGESLSFI